MGFGWLKHPVDSKYHASRIACGCVQITMIPRLHSSEIACNAVIIIYSHLFCNSLFRTQLVGKAPVGSSQVKKCINDWIASGTNAVQSLTLGGTTLTVNLVHDTGTCTCAVCIANFTRRKNYQQLINCWRKISL